MVITPDVEIGKFIASLYSLPGSSAVFAFLQNKINVFAFRLKDSDIPFMKFSLNHINQKLQTANAKIALILRGSRRIIPNDENIYLHRNDLIYICCYSNQNTEIMRLFGVDHNPYEKAVIFGANTISYYLASQIEKDESTSNCCIIEDNAQKASKMAEKLNKTSVIFGEMMSDVILQDAGFANADISIAVTDKDKDNLLISLLSAKNKETQAISLINSKDYNLLAFNIRNNVIIDRSVITISAILQYLRKARIDEAYSVGRGIGEFWEIRLGEDSVNVGKLVKELKIPENSSIMTIIQGDKLVYDFENLHLQPEDKILLFVAPSDIREIERIFYL